MEKNIKYIDFSNESIDVSIKCCFYLMEKNFHYNSLETNINLLEKVLINYSIIKLSEWNVQIEDLMQLDNLESVCSLLNSSIPDKNKQSFFIQYIHCILYVIGKFRGQVKQIIWISSDEIDEEIKLEEIDNNITTVITNQEIPFYQLPYKILEKFKNEYLNEKSPILKK